MLPPGSFVNRPIPTCAALQAEVKTDSVFRTRLRNALHFPSDTAVIQTVTRLHPKEMDSPSVMKIYYARPGGAWGYKVRRVPAGTHVYADAKGTPLLLRICGNPCRPLPPAVHSHSTKIAAPYDPKEGDLGMVVEGREVAAGAFNHTLLARPQITLPPLSPALMVEESKVIEPMPVPVEAPILTGHAVSSLSPPPELAHLAPILSAYIPAQPPRGSSKTFSPAVVAPEPNSLSLLGGVGGAFVASVKIYRRRKR